MFWQTAVGAVQSSMVTVAAQVPVFAEASVTERVTVFMPRSAQENEDWLMENVGAPSQASEELLLIWVAVIEMLPAALRHAVKSWQTAVGAVQSVIVTEALQVEVFPASSVTVRVTVLAPMSVHENADWLSVRVRLASQASELVLLTCVGANVRLPVVSRQAVTS